MTERSPGPAVFGRKQDALALALLLLSVAVVFLRALVTSDVFYQRDIHSYWYPQVEVFVRAVAEGSTPLWNPYEGFGAPFLANPARQLLYPLTWLNLVLPPSAYYKLFVLAHTTWAGIGTYLLVRRLGADRLPALLAAHAFCLAGPFLSAASLHHHFTGAAWMPWVLLAFVRLLARAGLRETLVLAAAGALMLLAGSGDVVLMTALAALVLAGSLPLGQGGGNAGAGGPLRSTLARKAPAAAGAALLGVGIAAAQWLPTAVEVTEGWRLRFSPETSLYWSLHPASLLDVFVPGLLSQLPMGDALRGTLFESREPLLSSVYLGAAASYLLLLGLSVRAPWPRGGLLLGFALFLACALGRHTLVLPALLHLPGFGVVRYPVKYLWGAGLFWALLVGGGALAYTRVWSDQDRKRGRAAAALVSLLAVAALAAAVIVGRAPDRLAALVDPGRLDAPGLSATAYRLATAGLFAGLAAFLGFWRARREEATPEMRLALLALVAADLVLAGRPVNPLAPAELMAHRPAFAEAVGRGARIQVVAPPNRWLREQLVRGPSGWAPEWSWALGGIDLMIPPMGARWGLHGSYDGDFTGLAPRAFSTLVALARAADGAPRGRLLLERGSVDYVVTFAEGDRAGLEERARTESVFRAPLRLLRVPEPLPLVHVVEGLQAADEDQALRLFSDPGFDMRRVAVVDPGEPEAPAGPGPVGTARVRERRSDTLVIDAELDRPGLLVVREAYRPGWRAEIGGAEVPVIRANVLFRGVRLGAGRHRVRMTYRPWAAAWGAAISGLSVVVWLGLLWRSRRPGDPRAP